MMTTRVAGATPKVTMSARESIWIPCMLAALRIRAAKPSSASKTMAKRMRIALVARIDGQETSEKGCAGSQTRRVLMIAANPQSELQRVREFGTALSQRFRSRNAFAFFFMGGSAPGYAFECF